MIIELPIRLSTVFSMIPSDSKRVIDVGSDHGKLALHCLQSGIVDAVVCTDIHKEPAERTRKCLSDYNYSAQSEVYCTDGLKGVQLKAGDTVVIAGMGGNTIIDIMTEALSGNDKNILKEVTWCIQPQKSFENVRDYLADNGFQILDEEVCLDRDIYYQMMRVKYTGISYTLTEKEAYYGPVLLTKSSSNDLIQAFYKHLNQVLEVRARGDERIRNMLNS